MQPLTLAEVEVGLQQLHNGRSGALHGYISELLRFAKLVPTPEVPAPAHVLAPCLVVLFKPAVSTGQVPQWWKISLVTPNLSRPCLWHEALLLIGGHTEFATACHTACLHLHKAFEHIHCSLLVSEKTFLASLVHVAHRPGSVCAHIVSI